MDNSLHRCAYSLYPADTRSSPQPRAGGAGCNSRAGLVRFTLAQADYELGHGGNETFALWALNPRPSYPHAHHTHHSHESSASSTLADCDFAYASLAPRQRSTGATCACIIFAGSSLPRTNLRTLLALRTLAPMYFTAICGGLCMCVLWPPYLPLPFLAPLQDFPLFAAYCACNTLIASPHRAPLLRVGRRREVEAAPRENKRLPGAEGPPEGLAPRSA